MDYPEIAGYVSLIVFVAYALLEMKRTGATIFVLKVYTLIDIVATRLKIVTKRQPFPVVNSESIYRGVVSKNRFLRTLHRAENGSHFEQPAA